MRVTRTDGLCVYGCQQGKRVKAALALHQDDGHGDCSQCYDGTDIYEPPHPVRWPCPTVRALTTE